MFTLPHTHPYSSKLCLGAQVLGPRCQHRELGEAETKRNFTPILTFPQTPLNFQAHVVWEMALFLRNMHYLGSV